VTSRFGAFELDLDRRQLTQDGSAVVHLTPPLIRTAHGVGYAFAGTLERAAARPGVSRWIVAGTRRIPLSDGDNIIGRDPVLIIFHVSALGVSTETIA
jgi:hypothetical protein